MKPTTRTTEELKRNIEESLRLLRRLRDEIRVELHLAGMEAKKEWARLEQRVKEAEQVVERASDASKRTIEETIVSLKTFLGSLKTPQR